MVRCVVVRVEWEGYGRPCTVQQEGLLMQTRSLTEQCVGNLCKLEEGSGVEVEVRGLINAACGLSEVR